MKRVSAKEIALSGVSAALAVISVVLAHFVEPATVAFYGLSSLCLFLPILAGSPRGAVLSFVASAALSFLFVGYLSFLPFALMFGPYPVWSYYLRKLLKHPLFYLPIGVLVANAAFFSCFFLSSVTMEDLPILASLPLYAKYLVLSLGVTLAFIAFDIGYNSLLTMVKERVGKYFTS